MPSKNPRLLVPQNLKSSQFAVDSQALRPGECVGRGSAGESIHQSQVVKGRGDAVD